MAASISAIHGISRALDPVGYIPRDDAPIFEVRKTVYRGGLKIEAGRLNGWHVVRYTRKALFTATAVVAYSDSWFILREWGDFPEQGLRGIMREVA